MNEMGEEGGVEDVALEERDGEGLGRVAEERVALLPEAFRVGDEARGAVAGLSERRKK